MSCVGARSIRAWCAPLHTAGGLRALVARMGRPVPAERAERVRWITAPTLIVSGDEDRMVPMRVARGYRERIPDSELVVLEATGHMPQEERPQRIVAEISRWLAASGGQAL